MDSLVRVISVRDTPGFDAATLQPLNGKVVTFMVGNNGPFTLNYRKEEYTEQRVQKDIQDEVTTLRAIGAIPASTGY